MKNNTHCALLFICVNKENDDLYNKYTECVKHHNNDAFTTHFQTQGLTCFFQKKPHSLHQNHNLSV